MENMLQAHLINDVDWKQYILCNTQQICIALHVTIVMSAPSIEYVHATNKILWHHLTLYVAQMAALCDACMCAVFHCICICMCSN